MNEILPGILDKLSEINNVPIFTLSIIPYGIFLYYLYKNKIINNIIKVGFSLTIVFVLITIILSIISLNLYEKSLTDVDYLHGSAESFLTLADLVILYGVLIQLNENEVKNS